VLPAGVVTHNEAIVGPVRVGLALTPLAHDQSIRATPAAHARTAERVHALRQAVGIADAWAAGVNRRELADAVHTCARSAGIEDRALVIDVAVLVAALAEAALIPRLAVNDGHDTNAIDATVVDAGIIILLAAAVPMRRARAPARAVNARFAFIAAAAGILSSRSARKCRACQDDHRDAERPPGHAARERNGKAVKVIRIHADNSA
jgi:hypothetical protein